MTGPIEPLTPYILPLIAIIIAGKFILEGIKSLKEKRESKRLKNEFYNELDEALEAQK